jgi:hypothetical protein
MCTVSFGSFARAYSHTRVCAYARARAHTETHTHLSPWKFAADLCRGPREMLSIFAPQTRAVAGEILESFVLGKFVCLQ